MKKTKQIEGYVKLDSDSALMKTVFLSVHQSSQPSDWYIPPPNNFSSIG
jgi:hypothetical protein